jgi:hypothetical protein
LMRAGFSENGFRVASAAFVFSVSLWLFFAAAPIVAHHVAPSCGDVDALRQRNAELERQLRECSSKDPYNVAPVPSLDASKEPGHDGLSTDIPPWARPEVLVDLPASAGGSPATSSQDVATSAHDMQAPSAGCCAAPRNRRSSQFSPSCADLQMAR